MAETHTTVCMYTAVYIAHTEICIHFIERHRNLREDDSLCLDIIPITLHGTHYFTAQGMARFAPRSRIDYLQKLD